MLANDFYIVLEKRLVEGGFEVDLKFNENHPIYQAHFPGNPITPGVCILQTGKELLMDHYQESLTIHLAKNIKFLNIISPLTFPIISFMVQTQIDSEQLVNATILVKEKNTVFAKFSSVYKKV